MTELYVVLGVAFLAAIFSYSWYAGIVKARNKVQEALSGIDVQLKKRHNLIPNILKIAQKFMEHEKQLLTEITELRGKAVEKEGQPSGAGAALKEKFDIEGMLQSRMGQLMVQVENYPDLKSDTHMLEAQRTYNEIEEHIAASRRFYNAAVTKLRDMVQIFPGSIFAGWAGVRDLPPYFEVTEQEAREPVDATDFLK